MTNLDVILLICGTVVTALLTVLVVVVPFSKPWTWHKTLFVTLGGISVVIYSTSFILALKEDRAAKSAKTQTDLQSQKTLDGIKEQLTEAKVENGILEGKLTVFGQFAPAVLELARASELNTRKQYEQKVLTNKELGAFVAQTVKKMRDWQNREDAADTELDTKLTQETSQIDLSHIGDPGSPERQNLARIYAEHQTAMLKLDTTFRTEFNENISGDAQSARNQLLIRLGANAEPQVGKFEHNGMYVFQGTISGSDPVGIPANYLERFAKKLLP